MLAVYPKSEVPSYSRYMASVNGNQPEEQTGQEIVDSLIERLKQRKEALRHGNDGI